MKKLSLYLWFHLYMLFFSHGICQDSWSQNWLKGINFYENKQFLDAINTYNLAIYEMGLNNLENFSLLNDRALAYVEMAMYENAISDCTKIITSSEVSRIDMLNALWTRSNCYAKIGDIEKFIKDFNLIKQLDSRLPHVEKVQNLFIINNIDCNKFTSYKRKLFIELLLACGLCIREEDISFF